METLTQVETTGSPVVSVMRTLLHTKIDVYYLHQDHFRATSFRDVTMATNSEQLMDELVIQNFCFAWDFTESFFNPAFNEGSSVVAPADVKTGGTRGSEDRDKNTGQFGSFYTHKPTDFIKNIPIYSHTSQHIAHGLKSHWYIYILLHSRWSLQLLFTLFFFWFCLFCWLSINKYIILPGQSVIRLFQISTHEPRRNETDRKVIIDFKSNRFWQHEGDKKNFTTTTRWQSPDRFFVWIIDWAKEKLKNMI